MPTFPTPPPTASQLEVAGEIRIVAGEQADTVVEVVPATASREADRRAAERTQVHCSGGVLTVKTPRTRSPFGPNGMVAISIRTPAGASVEGRSLLGNLVVEGPLGNCRFTTAMGDIRLTEAAAVVLTTSLGEVVADRLGDAKIRGAGLVRVARIEGDAEIKNVNGETRLGRVTGDLRVKSSNGGIFVDRAGGRVEARTAVGDVRLGEVGPGQVSAYSAAGDLAIGVADGVAAWLDVSTSYGRAASSLESTTAPEAGAPTVEVRGRTSYGDITVHRSERTPS
jgi:hypothetical protein